MYVVCVRPWFQRATEYNSPRVLVHEKERKEEEYCGTWYCTVQFLTALPRLRLIVVTPVLYSIVVLCVVCVVHSTNNSS